MFFGRQLYDSSRQLQVRVGLWTAGQLDSFMNTLMDLTQVRTSDEEYDIYRSAGNKDAGKSCYRVSTSAGRDQAYDDPDTGP